MKVIIAGSRHMQFADRHLIPYAVKESGFDITEVGCGLAKGADTLGKRWAMLEANIPVVDFPADWGTYGKAAGPIRNSEMRDWADAAIIFIWDGSRGSMNMLQQMQKVGKPCFVVWNGNVEVG
jgi:hypothetical protein